MPQQRSPTATVEAYADALGRHDPGAMVQLVHPGVVGHEQTADIVGFDAFRQNLEGWIAAYPDLRITTADLFEQGDRAAWRWTLCGTHAPSGHPVRVSGIIIFRVEQGLVAEYWGHYDRLGLLSQQGAMSD